MDEREKRIDLNSELGMSRRDLIKRGAIVGGTLLWVAPAIQSMGVAKAQEAGASAACATCYCRWRRQNGSFIADKCYSNGVSGILLDDTACAANCVAREGPPGQPTNPDIPPNAFLPNTQHDYCSGTQCSCVSGEDGPAIGDRTVCS